MYSSQNMGYPQMMQDPEQQLQQQQHQQQQQQIQSKESVMRVDLDTGPDRRTEGWGSNIRYGKGFPDTQKTAQQYSNAQNSMSNSTNLKNSMNRLNALPPIRKSKDEAGLGKEEEESNGCMEEDDDEVNLEVDLGESAGRKPRQRNRSDDDEERKKGDLTDRSEKEEKRKGG
jgi:hypothetical protein